MPVKTCRSCGQSLPLDGFYRDRSAKDGHKSHCKKCTGEAQKRALERPEVREKRRAYSKAWNSSERGREYHRRYKKSERYLETEERRRTRADNAIKIAARYAVKDAIRYGRLKKKPCAVCGEQPAQAHHLLGYDAEHRTEVVWLCAEHHVRAEAHFREEVEKRASLR
jgi:hypothetical protein